MTTKIRESRGGRPATGDLRWRLNTKTNPHRMQWFVLGVSLFAVLVLACDDKSSKHQPVFYCQRAASNHGVPIQGGTRTCEQHPLEEAIYGSSFTTPIAYCFTRSMMGIPPAQWDSKTVDSCSPTPAECEEERVGRGSALALRDADPRVLSRNKGDGLIQAADIIETGAKSSLGKTLG